jgi:hypothetical protein
LSWPRLLHAKDRRSRDAQPSASKPARGSRLLINGCIGANWNRFGIARKQKVAIRQGGRGFISLESGRPATVPTLMRRLFLGPGSFEFFSRIQTFKRPRQRFVQAKQCPPSIRASAFGHLFSRCGLVDQPFEKLSRNSRGGGGVGHDRFL